MDGRRLSEPRRDDRIAERLSVTIAKKSRDVIGFVSQFFSSTLVPSARRALSAAVPRAQTAAGLARGDRCLEPKARGWIPCHLAVSCMTIRILRARSLC